MEDSTKFCITLIILAGIWFMAQPIEGNISIPGNINNTSYFNLTNSTISGNVQISGNMPVGMILPMFFIEIFSDVPQGIKDVFFLFVLAISLLSFVVILVTIGTVLDVYRENKKHKEGENHG